MSVLQNLNYLEEISAIPCASPDPLLLVRTAFESAPPALLRLYLPGCSEIMQARVGISPGLGLGKLIRPAVDGLTKPRRGMRHGRKVGGAIQGISPPVPLGGRQFLYKTGFFGVERLLWYWLVADVSTAFVATWASLIHQQQNCELPGAGELSTQIVPHTYIPGSRYLSFVPKLLTGCADARLNEITIPAGINASIVWGMQWQPWPDPDSPETNMSTWLEEIGVDGRYGFATMNNPNEANKRWTGGFHKHKNNGQITPRKYRIGVENPSANAAMTATLGFLHVSCSGFPQPVEWGCKLKPVSWPDFTDPDWWKM